MSATLKKQEIEQLAKFLKESSILKVIDDQVLLGVSLNLETLDCGPGHIVFREGDQSDGFYIIRSGSVEVKRHEAETPIAYLTAGECFGEMSLIKGEPRTATIRVPEKAVVLRLPVRAAKDLKAKFPLLDQEMAKLAQERGREQLAFKAPGLQGNTAFFDLTTVIQAVAASRQSGFLNMFGAGNSPTAKLIFREGKLVAAYFFNLFGEEAIFELLNSGEPTDFDFERRDLEDIADEAVNIADGKSIDMLLLESVRRIDEYPNLLDTVGGADMTFSFLTRQPKWDDLTESVADLARKLKSLIELGLNVEGMFPLVESDRFSIVQALADMIERGFIAKAEAAPAAGCASPATEGAASAATRQLSQSGVTSELDMRQFFRGPAKVASTIYALNMVASNLASLVEPSVVTKCLTQALAESTSEFPQLKSLKVHRGGKTLDVRAASPELSGGSDSPQALTHLTKRFLQLIALKQSG